jgi:bifunctional non-homologous end joining protein LigD
MALTKYRQKRKFTKTSEPRGSAHASGKKLEFVVQKHDASHLHYDFRLELDGVLKSWAVPKGPSLNPSVKRLAMQVEDHPYDYRTFEGTIPKGNYGAGEVIVWDNGTYEPAEQSASPEKNLKTALKKGHLSFTMHGQKLKGEFSLIKSPKMGENAWLLIKKDDNEASKEDIRRETGSVLSDKNLETEREGIPLIDAPKTNLPKRIKPMLATLTDEVFDDEDWLYEIKWDGYRAVSSWNGKQAELYSRNGNDFSKRYAPITEALRDLSQKCVLDGEIVMVDAQGKSHFELLQNYQRGAEGELQYQVFDILWLNGRDIRELPLINRRELLKYLLNVNDVIRYSDHVIGQGKKFFATAEKAGLEGIIAKRCDSIYKDNYRSKQWLKIKTHKRQEVVIGGFTEPKGSRKHIGALLVGIYENDEFKYVGHVGGGIPTTQLKPLRQKLEALERQNSPFQEKVRPNAQVHWVKPKLLCEVTFGEWTNDGRMRQPIFIGLRSDKEPKKVTKEVAMANPKSTNQSNANRHFEFTHQDKVFFPENKYTKGDLIAYYETVSKTMLSYLRDRPCNLLRQPNGYKGIAFFQKDMKDTVPNWVTTETVYSESNKKNLHYYVCASKEALMYMVQLGCIEINPWSSVRKRLDKPDWAVIDLDPEGIGFDKVVKVAQAVHAVCEELNIPNYPKTSGKTGIHIFIPTHAQYTYEQVRQFAQLIATLVHERTEKLTSLERNPKKRQHKIYLDYLQNRESQTLAAPYSARPTKEASVSTPLHWDEVNDRLNPTKFTIKTMPARLQKVGDLWKPVTGKGIDLKKVMGKIEL